ncbi:MAG TPA: membrane dipeptidase [Trueperaceae bacterium]
MPTQELRENKGFHPILERDHPYVFIDGCMQAWPDADFANAHRHGATCYSVTAWRVHDDFEDAVEGLMFWHLVVRQNPNLRLALSAQDIVTAKETGGAALLMHAQGGEWIGAKLHRIEAMVRLGLRMMLPAYNRMNHICDGCLERSDNGLTAFGKQVVAEANRLGLLLDGSHVGRRSTLEMIDLSSQPIVFSHSNVRALVDSPRNITDEQILACTARGGVIGLAPFGPFCLKQGQTTWPTLSDFIDHVDYVVQLTGSTDTVGIGTDMSLGTYPYHTTDPWGEPDYVQVGKDYARHVCGDVRSPMRALADFNTYSQVWNLIDALAARGYDDQQIGGFLGGNFLRVFGQVWPS